MKKIVLTGGGSAGHVYPALALLPNLKEYEIHYIGSNGIEKEILKKYKRITYHEIPAVKLVRKLTPKNLLIPFKLFKSIRETKKILREISPNIIFSKGGFVSVPVAFAGKALKIPVVSHESDLSMGLANKLILKKCNCMCTTFSETSKISNKCVFTGQPLREDIFNGNPTVFRSKFSKRKPILLVIGGSLGAKFLNEIIRENLDFLLREFNIIHICGKNNLINIEKEGYIQLEFTDKIEDVYAACDLCLSRAGAGVISELLALNKPMLLVPLSKKCSRGDQIENANLFKKLGYANVLLEEDYSKEKLINNIDLLLKNKAYYTKSMQTSNAQNANKRILEIIKRVEK